MSTAFNGWFCTGDFVARTDFLWKAKLKTEQEEVETMRGINKVASSLLHFLKKQILFINTTVEINGPKVL